MLKTTTIFMTTLILLLGLSLSQAQDLPMQQEPAEPVEVSDEELQEWVDVFVGVQEINQQIQMQLPPIIEEAGLSIEKFQEIMQAEEMGQAREDIDASESEMASYDEAMDEIMEIQEGAEEEMIEHIEGEGMELERYEQIMMALNQDPELAQRAEELLMEAQGMQQQPPQQQAPPQDPR